MAPQHLDLALLLIAAAGAPAARAAWTPELARAHHAAARAAVGDGNLVAMGCDVETLESNATHALTADCNNALVAEVKAYGAALGAPTPPACPPACQLLIQTVGPECWHRLKLTTAGAFFRARHLLTVAPPKNSTFTEWRRPATVFAEVDANVSAAAAGRDAVDVAALGKAERAAYYTERARLIVRESTFCPIALTALGGAAAPPPPQPSAAAAVTAAGLWAAAAAAVAAAVAAI